MSVSTMQFGKDESKIIRGFAILAMVMHHCITLAADSVGAPAAFAASMKICVGLFTFLVGYGFCFSRQQTVKGGMKRALKLLLEFWTLMLLIFIPLYIIGGG